MTTAAYSEILRDLEAFLSLCQALELGEEVRASRFNLYRGRIRDLSAEIGRLRAGVSKVPIYKKLQADLPRYLVAVFESQEVAGMLPFLTKSPPDVLRPRLRRMLSGPEMPSEEDPGLNQARNIQFELWMAATLSRAGGAVVLAEPDLQCNIGDVTILIACKRLFSVSKLTRRINEATAQLRRSLSGRPEGTFAGVIAISLARILTATDRSETISSQAEGQERLAARIEVLVERRAKWQQSREAQAILFHVASTFTNLEVDRIQYGYFLAMYGAGPVAAVLNEKLQPLAG